MPELHSDDPRSAFSVPVPYPAACRPQAWSAAAAISVLSSSLGLEPRDGELAVHPGAFAGALSVSCIRFNGADVAVSVSDDGTVALS